MPAPKMITLNFPPKTSKKKKTFFQRGHANSQEVHENMLKSPNQQGDANQTHNEVSAHTH